ncbi:MAG: PRC-barrel domain-containing protein [Planctomycetota bacterium]|nr:PRC-barrel domain-containing protein [Planctomycetota bacterium]
MRTTRSNITRTIACIVLAAGAATPAFAQGRVQPRTPTTTERDGTREQDRRQDRGRTDDGDTIKNKDYYGLNWLMDIDITDTGGDTIGEVSDFVIDRGSGQIEFIIAEIDGRDVAVPYASLRWNSGNNQFVSEIGAAQYREHPAFSSEDWRKMREPVAGETAAGRMLPDWDWDWDDTDADDDDMNRRPTDDRRTTDGRDRASDGENRTTQTQDGMRRDSRQKWDEYEGRYDRNQTASIEGEVTSVERIRRDRFGEQVILTVRSNDGETRRVAIGPSWYAAAGGAMPSRGDTVAIDAYRVTNDSAMLTARRMTVNGTTVNYRTDQGQARWGDDTIESSGRRYRAEHWRYILASELDGMDARARGTDCGEVQSVVVERRSGRVVFLSIDPDDNFLGIGDTTRLVPWDIASIGADGIVHLDANKAMILASPQTPSDLTLLSTNSVPQMVYRAYEIKPPQLQPVRYRSMSRSSGGSDRDGVPYHQWSKNDAWWRDDPRVSESIRNGQTSTWTGTVLGMKTVNVGESDQPHTAVRVKLSNGTTQTALLGPAKFMEGQKHDMKQDREITLNVVRATIGDDTHWIARSFECDGERMTLWNGNSPVWDDR